jgi:hypothetical protein
VGREFVGFDRIRLHLRLHPLDCRPNG